MREGGGRTWLCCKLLQASAACAGEVVNPRLTAAPDAGHEVQRLAVAGHQLPREGMPQRASSRQQGSVECGQAAFRVPGVDRKSVSQPALSVCTRPAAGTLAPPLLSSMPPMGDMLRHANLPWAASGVGAWCHSALLQPPVGVGLLGRASRETAAHICQALGWGI